MTDRMGHPARRNCHRCGFTMVELMVVVGIIIILAAILLPVISRARKSGYQAATLGRMQAIMSAIDDYYSAFTAYPGPVSDAELLSATPSTYGGAFQQKVYSPTQNPALYLTGTENLTLGLLGGMQISTTSPTPTASFVSTDVGSGPLNFNPLTAKRYGPFINPKAGGLEPQVSTGGWVKWSDPSHPNGPVQYASSYYDTTVPEFTDAYPDALPILYLRAVQGATGSILGAQDPATTSNPNPVAVSANAAYDPSQLQPYLFPAYVGVGASQQAAITTTSSGAGQGPSYNTSAGTPDGAVTSASTGFPWPQYYFGQANAPSQPRNTKGYLLISAGLDREFLTADDTINGSRAR